MKVQDVMTAEVRTCRLDTNLSAAVMQMWNGDCGALPVLADGGELVGMITDRDICIAAATKNRDPEKIRVDEVISGKAYSCSPETEIHEALEIMQEKRVRRLPVINSHDGKLAGILSMNDVALKAQGSCARSALIPFTPWRSRSSSPKRVRPCPWKPNGSLSVARFRLR